VLPIEGLLEGSFLDGFARQKPEYFSMDAMLLTTPHQISMKTELIDLPDKVLPVGLLCAAVRLSLSPTG
jgi:hypothetical protein